MDEPTMTAGLVLAITLLGLGVLIGYALGLRDKRATAPAAGSELPPPPWVPLATGWALAPVQAPPAPPAAMHGQVIRTPDNTGETAAPVLVECAGRHREPVHGMDASETTAAFPSYRPTAGVL